MKSPAADQFAAFYEAVHGYAPFPWQERLAGRVCGGSWPHCVALPTAAGKTACIDIAVFALACRGAGNSPRRVFFVVDRRIVVDQAYDHAKKLAGVLHEAKAGVLFQVAESLRGLAGDERPLDAYALRGGMYRETAWARSPLQPTVIASTVDQVGSRLLFRGYGVSDSMKPVHAGLVGNDALILLDEAHCARPFDQTMQAIKGYRAWAGDGVTPSPFHFVSITATPAGEVPANEIERDNAADRTHAVLGKRINASKPAKLVVAEKAKGKNGRGELVKVLEAQARELAKTADCVGVIVNRVATARELKAKFGDDAVLLTGRMRPLDRDRLFDERLRPLLSNADTDQKPPKFVIGTQCLEVGADFDFHALVTECASLDALRQRFGRLNRVARRDAANAVVVVRGDQTEVKEKESEQDPIYGNSLPATWAWLNEKATDGVFDFGVAAVRAATEGVDLGPLNAPTDDAPVLLPAFLDCWVQTHPIPTPDPDPALFLHGPKQPGQPDVRVVFRSDLGEDEATWAEVVGLCPPSSSEAVAVPIGVFKKWLAGEKPRDESGDVEGGPPEPDEDETPQASRRALRWRGPEKSGPVAEAAHVFPDDLFVVPCAEDGTALGDFPFGLTDYAQEAFQRSRDRALLRLPGVIIPEDADKQQEAEVVDAAIRAILEDEMTPAWERLAATALAKPKDREVDKHPTGGVVVTGKRRLRQFDPEFLDDDNSSYSPARAVPLVEHSRGVAGHARRFADGCGLPPELYTLAGLYHDIGKLDPRFQAMLRQSSPRTAVGEPLAKSARSPRTKEERAQAREVHCYPVGARHELLSAAVVGGHTSDDLVLHLIATHHGSARPFAGAVEEDGSAGAFPVNLCGLKSNYPSAKQDIVGWNAELPERFWRVVRRYGWWGAAYREAVFRLADHAQSRAEQDESAPFVESSPLPPLPPPAVPRRPYPLPLTGLDGSNPLAFLAALGTLRLANRAWSGTRLSWEARGQWTPVLHLPEEMSEGELVAALLERAPSDRRCVEFAEDVKIRSCDFRTFQLSAQAESAEDREFADFLSAYADESVTIKGGENAGKTKPTEFYFLAGQQKLRKLVRQIATKTTASHLTKSLFAPWVYDDPLKELSLRWDPCDDLRYATRFVNPSDDKTKGRRGSVLGANRLAFEGLALFPCCANRDRLATTGFHVVKRRSFFTWPVWNPAWGIDTVRSVLSGVELNRSGADGPKLQPRARLGVATWYQCEKVPNSDYSNLTPSRDLYPVFNS